MISFKFLSEKLDHKFFKDVYIVRTAKVFFNLNTPNIRLITGVIDGIRPYFDFHDSVDGVDFRRY
jgi:hypothetical protein